MATSFFSLPLELRHEIYGYLWIDSRSASACAVDGLCFNYASQPTKERWDYQSDDLFEHSYPRLPTWLPVSRAFMAEALNEFDRFGAATLVFDDPGHVRPAYEATTTYFPGILGPFSVRELHVFVGALIDDVTVTGANGVGHLAFGQHDANNISMLIDAALGSAVQTLFFVVQIDHSCEGTAPHDHMVSMYALQGVDVLKRQLKRLEIEIEEYVEGARERESFEAALGFEVAVLENSLEPMTLQRSVRTRGPLYIWTTLFTQE
ncbi:hypothetical protein CC86DRAFT_400637 [Ophiobolus disseminans]|uniref:Uncharacterized protein n=1 Tax=Ophiobolus disseminans TaxID=1469910 RepID=A0A6A7AG21_9PLEO|nr:hypothetical protein CC86DRAFT_400637 [Ophiobolus disseminans]